MDKGRSGSCCENPSLPVRSEPLHDHAGCIAMTRLRGVARVIGVDKGPIQRSAAVDGTCGAVVGVSPAASLA
jgi:hypothetical protein